MVALLNAGGVKALTVIMRPTENFSRGKRLLISALRDGLLGLIKSTRFQQKLFSRSEAARGLSAILGFQMDVLINGGIKDCILSPCVGVQRCFPVEDSILMKNVTIGHDLTADREKKSHDY